MPYYKFTTRDLPWATARSALDQLRIQFLGVGGGLQLTRPQADGTYYAAIGNRRRARAFQRFLARQVVKYEVMAELSRGFRMEPAEPDFLTLIDRLLRK